MLGALLCDIFPGYYFGTNEGCNGELNLLFFMILSMKKHRLASSPTSDALRTILLSSYEVTSKQHGLHDHSIFKSKRITTTGFVTRRLCPVVVEARLFFFGILVIISKIEVNGTKRWSRLCYFFTSSEISLSDLAHMISKQLKQSHGVTLVDVVIPTNASYIYMCVCLYI